MEQLVCNAEHLSFRQPKDAFLTHRINLRLREHLMTWHHFPLMDEWK